MIVFVGVLSALLVIPQVRAVAGGILASSAVIGLVVGFAAQRTIGNFVAGLLIAFTQPLRLGDYVEIAGVEGVVEEIGLTYTFIRTDDNDRLVIPNEKLASDTIRNSTIRSREKLAEVTVQVPLDTDLEAARRRCCARLRRTSAPRSSSPTLDGRRDAHACARWAPTSRRAERLEQRAPPARARAAARGRDLRMSRRRPPRGRGRRRRRVRARRAAGARAATAAGGKRKRRPTLVVLVDRRWCSCSS